MRRRTYAALGLGAALSLGAGLLPPEPALGPLAPLAPLTVLGPAPAAATELETFEGCPELLDWYVDTALPQVTAWGLGWGGLAYGGVLDVSRDARAALPLAAAESSGSADLGVGNGGTGTNIQEAGVDEPDFVKTDGRTVVELRGRELVLTDVTDEPREVSRLTLPRGLRHGELLLVNDRVVVLAQDFGYYGGPFVDSARVGVGMADGSTQVATVDVSDPAAPTILTEQEYDGGLVSARQYGGTVRLVLGSSTPRLEFVHPTRRRSAQEARRENRRIVRASDLGDWLPTVTTDGEVSPLLDCTDVRHPGKHSGLGTLTVVTFPAAEPTQTEATAVSAGGHLVYSSVDRLYVATTDSGWVPRPRDRRAPTTEVHAFALDGTSTSYVASGEVPGTVRDRWSFSEHDGHLRVATALGPNPWNPRENAVVVLDEQGGALVEVGRVGAMGIKEQIQSVRWFGDLAVVVTFRQIDPLYTVDLSDPTHPRVLGELKITGFSAYLHPIGGDRLLGLGQDATRRGRSQGAQVAVFDIADLADPRRLGTVGFGRFTELPATWDPRGFTFLPARSVALTTLQDYDTGTVSLVTLRIGSDGALEVSTRRLGGWRVGNVRTLPLTDGTIALVAGHEVTKLVV